MLKTDINNNSINIIKGIEKIAEKNSARESSQKTRFITKDKIKIGECFRQGDLYVFRVADNHPIGNELKRNQIADGVSVGARHILNGDFKIYDGVKSPSGVRELNSRIGLGYCFDVKESTVLVHPEHDNYVFKTTGRFQVLHQTDLRTLRRAAD